MDGLGNYANAYLKRTMVAMAGLGAILPEDAIYPNTNVDHRGSPLSGGSRHLLHFDEGELPPANAFWSLTVYDEVGYQAANEIGRFALGDRDELTSPRKDHSRSCCNTIRRPTSGDPIGFTLTKDASR